MSNDSMNLMDLANHVDMASDPFDDVVVESGNEESISDDNIEASSDDAEESQIEAPSMDQEDSDEPVEETSEDNSEEPVEEINPEEALQSLNEKLESGELEIQLDEESSVTLKELKNSYVTSKDIARKFSELDVEKKAVQKDVAEIEGYINEFAGKLRNGDSVGAMQYFGEFAGVPPFQIKAQLIEALRPEILRREQMSAVELQNEYLSEQNDYLHQQRESENERRSMEQANMELQNSINNIRETNGIDEATWEDAKNFVEQNLEEGMQLTPELVKDFIINERNYQQAESVVNNFEGDLGNKLEWAERLADVKEQYPHFTEEDLMDVLKSAYETVSKQDTEQKLAKKVEAKKAPTQQPKTKKTQAQAESEIDPALEDWL